jgi:hypothetical protein
MLLSVATVAYMDVDSGMVAAVAAAGILVALARPALPARVPIWAHRLAFPAILAFFAGDLWHTGQLLPAIVRLDLLLLLLPAHQPPRPPRRPADRPSWGSSSSWWRASSRSRSSSPRRSSCSPPARSPS